MKRFIPTKTKTGMLAIKVNYPCVKLSQTIDLISDLLHEFGDYRIVDFGLTSPNYKTNYLKFNTNFPWELFDGK